MSTPIKGGVLALNRLASQITAEFEFSFEHRAVRRDTDNLH